MVKVTKFVTSRPLIVIFFLMLMVVVLGSVPIVIWCTTTKKTTNDVGLRSILVSQIENIGTFIYPKTVSSTINLAKVIDSYLTNNNTDLTQIQTQIARVLFQAYSTIPQVSQVLYISAEGLLFSYITELNTSVAVFANSSGGDYTFYTQAVDQGTGRLYGNATKSQLLDLTHADWFQAAQRNQTTAFVGNAVGGKDNETMFQSVVSLDSKKGVVSLGIPVKYLTDALNRLNLPSGAELYVWTMDGTVLVREGSLNASLFISNGSICFGRDSKFVPSQCIPKNCSSSGYNVEIKRSKFKAFCSVLEVSGVPLRFTLMFPNKGRGKSIKNVELYMLIVTMFLAWCWPLGFVFFMMRAARREMHMRSTLINQMEATQQAERKSMNKSQAFATASHDIRGSLAGINGLIDFCREEVRTGSDPDTSLKQVKECTNDLLGLLNSVLDMSKIESGKMHLEEKEFDLVKLLEDVADFFHPVAVKKGVDVVLDLHDGSIFKFSKVQGDSGKLKQILNNLVSNAVKFTVDGHISIRAWAQKPGSKSSLVLASDSKGGLSMFSKCFFCKNEDQPSNYEIEISNSIRNNANTMEFVFEVDDTGKGIPMEMRKSVFENYVQVRETAQSQQGTGLGLGIVQSLVRLMGGEIRITDKAMGEKGTCFQFNVLLSTSESSVSDVKVRQDIEAGGDYILPNLGLTINTSLGSSSKSLRHLSPRLNYCLNSSPKLESSRVVLLLKDEERRRVTEKYIKTHGIKVTVVEKWEDLSNVLERLFGVSPQSSLGRARTEYSLRNEVSSSSPKELPLIGMDSIDSRTQIPRSMSFFAVVLLVIDAKAGPISEMSDIVDQFRRGLNHGISCKVVWINEPSGRGSERGDICCSKPLHGSRLNRVLNMLPECRGVELKEASTGLHRHSHVVETSPKPRSCEIQEEGPSSRYNKKIGKTIMAETPSESVRSVHNGRKSTEEEQGTSRPSDDEILRGKRVLVVDDNYTIRLVATAILKKLGVFEVKQCNNGKEALRLVSERLKQSDQEGFDYIFMDCQMPEMDGYKATEEIRKLERQYGVHTPIIALSGHDSNSNEARQTIQSGMDAFLEKNKNMTQDSLMNIIREIESKRTK